MTIGKDQVGSNKRSGCGYPQWRNFNAVATHDARNFYRLTFQPDNGIFQPFGGKLNRCAIFLQYRFAPVSDFEIPGVVNGIRYLPVGDNTRLWPNLFDNFNAQIVIGMKVRNKYCRQLSLQFQQFGYQPVRISQGKLRINQYRLTLAINKGRGDAKAIILIATQENFVWGLTSLTRYLLLIIVFHLN